jgi:hypothetical protein
VSLVKLLYYDPERPNDVIMASMYFNTMTSKTEWDSFLDRVHQSRSLTALYCKDLAGSRQQMAKASGKKLRTGDFKVAEVVEWMGARANLLSDGEQFNTPKNTVTIGTIARIGDMIRTDALAKWFQSYNHHSNHDVRKDARTVFQQRYMTSNCLWDNRSVTCVFPFRLFTLDVLCFWVVAKSMITQYNTTYERRSSRSRGTGSACCNTRHARGKIGEEKSKFLCRFPSAVCKSE